MKKIDIKNPYTKMDQEKLVKAILKLDMALDKKKAGNIA